MKRCPTCNQDFADDTNFCLFDGSVLTGEFDGPVLPGEQETVVLPVKPGPSAAPSIPVSPKPPQPWLYLATGGMAVTIIALVVWMFVLQPKEQNDRGGAIPQPNSNTSGLQKPASPQPVTPTPVNPPPSQNTSTPLPPVKSVDPAGHWKGKWSAPSGALFDIEFTLNETGVNQIEGQIKWTMLDTRRPEKKDKIGKSAVEYIQGVYDPSKRLLNLKGYRKDDPDNVLVMTKDEYHLTVSEDGSGLAGRARNGGKWDGILNMGRN